MQLFHNPFSISIKTLPLQGKGVEPTRKPLYFSCRRTKKPVVEICQADRGWEWVGINKTLHPNKRYTQ